MAQCQSCGKRGMFLSLNRNGVCGECAMHVPRDIANRERIIKESMMPPLDLVNRERIIKESMALIKKTTNLDTMMSRLDLVTEHLNVLVGYEQRGIPTTIPAPSHLLAELEKSRGQIIYRGAEDTVKAALAMMGKIDYELRLPLCPMAEKNEAILKTVMQKYGLIT